MWECLGTGFIKNVHINLQGSLMQLTFQTAVFLHSPGRPLCPHGGMDDGTVGTDWGGDLLGPITYKLV